MNLWIWRSKLAANFLRSRHPFAKRRGSGFYFSGSGEQSVAEHLNRTAYIGYALGMLHGSVDVAKIMKMCLFHDFAESRVSDLNYVHQNTRSVLRIGAIEDPANTLPFAMT